MPPRRGIAGVSLEPLAGQISIDHLPAATYARRGRRSMGAWGVGPFENDDALDFIGELSASGLSSLRAALEEVTALQPGAYVDAPSASCAVAAAEVVAALKGAPLRGLPSEVSAWIQRAPADDSLVPAARRAIDRIATDSELRDLWEDSGEASGWNAYVADLLRRLT
jgi:hypothetical protein